jgi:arylsulfatase A-like enzyme
MKKCLLPLLLIVCAFASSALAQSARPNIIVILADDLGYGDVGFNGCLDIPTPNIDSVATNGVLCTNGYSTHPFCGPSRAGLITGRYQQRFGYE